MDPNVNLRQQREIIGAIRFHQDQPGNMEDQQTELADLAGQLADLADALDEWLIHNGALPDAWRRS